MKHRIQRALDTYLAGEGLMEEVRGRLGADKARKRALVAELERLDAASPARLDTERLTREARARVADVKGLLARHVPHTRQMLRSVLAAPIRVTPIVTGGRRGFRFEGQLAFDRVISGDGISDSRDGQFSLRNHPSEESTLNPPDGRYSLRLIREFRVSSPTPRRAEPRPVAGSPRTG